MAFFPFLQSSSSLDSLARRLPWWTTRTVAVSHGQLPVLILKDGTLVTGIRIRGIDTYALDDAELNQNSAAMRQLLNLLPSEGFLQAVFETGFDFGDLIDRFEGLANSDTQDILWESHRRRARLFRSDHALSRTQITYWVGHRQALGRLMAHGSRPRAFWTTRRHPTEITPEVLVAAAELLSHNVSQIYDALAVMGVGARVLSEPQVIAECHQAMNPHSSLMVPAPVLIETGEDIRQARTAGDLMDRPVVLRGPSLASQLPLGSMAWEPSHFVLDDPPVLHRVLRLQRFPNFTGPDFLEAICFLHMPGTPIRLVVTHTATDQQLKKEDLARRRSQLQSQLAGHSVNHDAKAAYEDYEQLLESLATSDARVFNTSCEVVVRAHSHDDLDTATREVKKGFAASNTVATTMVGQQLFGWLASLPGNGYTAPHPYPLLTPNCAHLTPYAQPSVGDEEDNADILFTTRQRSLRAVTWRQSGNRDDSNTFVIGATGSGKTFLFSHIMKSTMALGGHVVITDIKGPKNSTYRPIAELLGGQYVALDNLSGNVAFNPCPPQDEARRSDNSLNEARLDSLRSIVCMMAVPDIDSARDVDLYMRIAGDAIQAAYRATVGERRPPILSDIVTELERYAGTSDHFRALAADMAPRLRLWCEDHRRGALLNQPVCMQTTNPLTVFDFFGLAEDPALASVLISTLSARLFAKMQDLPLSTPKLFGFDEAWSFFEHSEIASKLIGSLFRVARSYGASCFVLSQSYRDVSESKAAAAMMANASIYVLNSHNHGHEEAAEVFGLTPRQLFLFKTLKLVKGHYSEALFVDKHAGDASVLRYRPTPWELWIDTSRAVDMELRARVLAKHRDPIAALAELCKRFPHGSPKEIQPAKEKRVA